MSDKIRFGLVPTEYDPSRTDTKVNENLELADVDEGEILLNSEKGILAFKRNGKIIKLRHNNTYQILVDTTKYSSVAADNEAVDKYAKDMQYLREIMNNAEANITPTIGDILIIKEVTPVSGNIYPQLTNTFDAYNEDIYDMRTYIRSDRINDQNRTSDTNYDIDDEYAEWLPMGGGVKNKTSDTRLDRDLRVVTETTGDNVGGYKDWDNIPAGTSVYDILKRLLQKIINPSVKITPYRKGNFSVTLKYGYRRWSEYTTGQITIPQGKRFYLPWGGDYEHLQIHSLNSYVDGEYTFPTVDSSGNKSSTRQKTGCTKTTDKIYLYFNNTTYLNGATYSPSTNHNLYYHYDVRPVNSANDRCEVWTGYSQGTQAVNNAGEKTTVRCPSGTIKQVVCYFNKYKPHMFLCWNSNTPSLNITSSNSDLSRLMLFNSSGLLSKFVPGILFDSAFNLSGYDINTNNELNSSKTYEYTVKKGTRCIQFYIPEGYELLEVINVDMMNKDVLNLFDKVFYENLDLNNYQSGTDSENVGDRLGYTKYTYISDIPFEKDVKFKVKYKTQ